MTAVTPINALTKPRCRTHEGRPRLPLGCPTCVRILCEQILVRRVVDALLTAGYKLQTNDGDEVRPDEPTDDRQAILTALMQVDDEWLTVFTHNGRSVGYVRFIYGNDGWDVISDYTVNLTDTLKATSDYADTLG